MIALAAAANLAQACGCAPAPQTEEPLSKLPEYEIFAIRYAKQDRRSEAHMFLGGEPTKLIQGLDASISSPTPSRGLAVPGLSIRV